jgi:dTMP kinase
MPGKLIVIDGTDGSGKATQTRLLVERLRASGVPVEIISFPSYETPTGRIVRRYLDGEFGTAQEVGAKLASILYAEDRYAAKSLIERWLSDGRIVIADRYVSSNMGHQGSLIHDPTERRIFLKWNDQLEYGTFELPRPDLSLILHLSAEIGHRLAAERDGDKTDILQGNIQHLKDAEATYLEIARTWPGFVLVECAPNGELLTREQIHELVWAEVSKKL